MMTNVLHRWKNRIAAGCLLMLVGLAGCDDDSIDSSLEFSEDNLLLKAAGDTMVIDVKAGSGWKAESLADWCIVEEIDGKLVVRVLPSDDVYERGTGVKITCGNNVVRLSVRQEPMVFEILDEKKTLSFEKTAATDVLKIHTNMTWKVEIADTTGWLQIADTVGTGDAELAFTASDNSQSKERTTTVRLRYGIRTLKLTATQNGGIRVDGHIQKHYGERDVDKGYNLIFLGDGFIAEDLIAETGIFDKAVEEACEALFAVEPYKTYKEYFNVYSIACESKKRGASTLGEEAKNLVFSAKYDPARAYYIVNITPVWSYAKQILSMTDNILKTNTVIVLLVNDERYGGNTYWYSDGRTLSVVPLNRDTQLPGGFANIFLHEVGGHGIGKLADEWSEEGVLLTTETITDLQTLMSSNYCYNLSLPRNVTFGSYPSLAWQLYNTETKYQSVLTTLSNGGDGGFGCVSDRENNNIILHSEAHCCMINHLPYFSVACRYSIVYNVMTKIGEPFTYDYFFEHDTFEVPEEQPVSDRPHLLKPEWYEVIE